MIEPESSDSVDEPSSSQSEPQETQLSSSSEAESALVVPEGGLFRWVGSEGARVITGLDNGNETSGYWYHYSDLADGGESYIKFPVELDYMGEDDYLEPVIADCNGLCGKYTLAKVL